MPPDPVLRRRLASRWSIALNIGGMVAFFAGFIMVAGKRHPPPPDWQLNLAATCSFAIGPLCALAGTVLAVIAIFRERRCLAWVALLCSAGGIGLIFLVLWAAAIGLSGVR